MSIIDSFMEGDRLNRLEQEMKSARILGKKECVRCGFCCHKRTCIPMPNDIKKTAKFIKLTPIELINKYYSIDKQSSGSDDYYVKPLGENIKDLAGKFIPDDRTFNEGKCIFLEQDGKRTKCKIYSVRPLSAKLMECWNKDDKCKQHQEIYNSWKGNQLKKQFGIDGEKLEV